MTPSINQPEHNKPCVYKETEMAVLLLKDSTQFIKTICHYITNIISLRYTNLKLTSGFSVIHMCNCHVTS